jgi:DNA-binding response OmpR family regulator
MAARILVVNDTEEILQAFRDLLEDEGYEVHLSGVAFTNVDGIVRLAPDLIILDYLFGQEKAGWQMLQLLRMHRGTAAIPVIICTAATHAVREIEGELIARGIRLVAKPFDIDELLAAVRQALDPTTGLHAAAVEPEPKADPQSGAPGDAPAPRRKNLRT